ncbi:MAG TPA: lysophospholipid acyltransferase family protein [Candidatus Syntrophosphaera thermopropionivorans]|nr:lysophospholipid acyltransferase family protein [Candidatus Syntrophosphaera thermopropionivorans]
MPEFLMKVEAVLGAGLLKLLRATLRIAVHNQPSDDYRCVYAFLHRNLLLLTLHRINSQIAVMVSSSKDGELIAGPLKYLSYIPIRGSSTHQGSQALKEMVRLSRTHSLAITPDGPKGPLGTIHPGLFQLAYLAKIPIIPVSANSSKEWLVKSWDRFRIPKPFSKLLVKYGEPIWVNNKEDFLEAEKALRESWKQLDLTLSSPK